MVNERTEIAFRGKRLLVPSIRLLDRTVIVKGKWLRMATVHQETWMEEEPVPHPDEFIGTLRTQGLQADIFSFSRRLPETSQTCAYYAEPDNLAAIPLTTYDEWWRQRLSRKTRQEVSRAQRLGLVVRPVPWDERLIRDIVDLFGRIPTKQGVPFAYYQRNFESVEREVSPYVERSQFIGAYDGGALVGYMKVVFMGRLASILNIICDESYFERRPANALMAKAVETCCDRGMQYLIYGRFTYGNKTNDSLSEFKRRSGFEKIILPRYYVPLSWRGRIAIGLRLHRGLQGLLPGKAIRFMVACRSAYYMRVVPLGRRFAGFQQRAASDAKRRVSGKVGD